MVGLWGVIAQAIAYDNGDMLGGIGLIVSQPDYSYTMNRLHQLVEELRVKPCKENRDKLSALFFSEPPTVEFRKYMARTILQIENYIFPFNESAQNLQNKAVSNWTANPEKLKKISLPILISTAKNDMVTNPAASYMLHEILPKSKLISYPSGGHFFLHHFPHQLADEVIKFFN